MWTLGINWKWHDSSAALVDGEGRVVAFSEEERFIRQKHAFGNFPVQAAQYCLRTAGITWRDVDTVSVGWNFGHLAAQADAVLSTLFDVEIRGRDRPKMEFVPHHLAHALSSFHASGFERAGVLVVDGSGEVDSATIYSADRDRGLTPLRSWDRRFSLGSLYVAVTQMMGFGRLDAGKTMGLAPYGFGEGAALPVADFAQGRVDERSPAAVMSAETGFGAFVEAWAGHLKDTFGPVRAAGADLHTDPVARKAAAGAQRSVEAALTALHRETVLLSGQEAVCLAGGVALNCVANGLLPEPVYIPPFPHDAGVALGAAWAVCPPKQPPGPMSPYLGLDLRHGREELARLREAGCTVSEFEPGRAVEALLAGRIGAVAEGRAEIGPRALGHRSIIALPRPASIKGAINGLKTREPWRPFAPVTTPDYAGRLWAAQGLRERYMIGTVKVFSGSRGILPGAVHVDGTTRPQVLGPDGCASIRALLSTLAASGQPPVLVNTSFNRRGEPIVNSAADAVDAFLGIGLDFLLLDGLYIERPSQCLARHEIEN